jgi:hypothetical protein
LGAEHLQAATINRKLQAITRGVTFPVPPSSPYHRGPVGQSPPVPTLCRVPDYSERLWFQAVDEQCERNLPGIVPTVFS